VISVAVTVSRVGVVEADSVEGIRADAHAHDRDQNAARVPYDAKGLRPGAQKRAAV